MNTKDLADLIDEFVGRVRALSAETREGSLAPADVQTRMIKLGAEFESLKADARKL